MGFGEGFGKVILFGEHFVVHGARAFAVGLGRGIMVELEQSNEDQICECEFVTETQKVLEIQ